MRWKSTAGVLFHELEYFSEMLTRAGQAGVSLSFNNVLLKLNEISWQKNQRVVKNPQQV